MTALVGRRVLMLLENNPYPLDDRVRREALTLVGAGYGVSVICPAGPSQPRREVLDGVVVYRYPAPSPGDGFLGFLWEYGYSMAWMLVLSIVVLLREGFDVIHANNPPDTLALIAALYKPFGKRFVFDHHDLSPEMYFARLRGQGNHLVFQALVRFEWLSCRLADHVIATNQSYRLVEMQRGHVAAHDITIVRNGPDLNRMHPVEPDPELRQKAATIFGYLGIMGFQDGVDYLLRALHHLVEDLGRTDFYAVLIGKGDAWEELKQLTSRLGLEEHVWFTGRLSDEDLVRYLSTADICVDPDPSNPFTDRSTMNKMSEYMALGKPIVAFDLPEHRVTARGAAVYVQPNDELAFARALAELMDDPARRQAMGLFARWRVETELAWDYSAGNLLAAYDELFPEPSAERVPAP